MKTLSEYNAEWSEKNKKIDRRMEQWINIACDHCGHELVGENTLLLTSPPQQNITCPGCGWKGRRFVY